MLSRANGDKGLAVTMERNRRQGGEGAFEVRSLQRRDKETAASNISHARGAVKVSGNGMNLFPVCNGASKSYRSNTEGIQKQLFSHLVLVQPN